VPHLDAERERAKKVVGIFPRLVLRGRSQANFFVEKSDGLRDLAPQKPDGRNAAVPKGLPGAKTGMLGPSRPNWLIVGRSQHGEQSAEIGMGFKPLGHCGQQALWIPAVVIWKTNQVSLGHPQANVTRSGGPGPAVKMPNA
jgi:hypothetical protein